MTPTTTTTASSNGTVSGPKSTTVSAFHSALTPYNGQTAADGSHWLIASGSRTLELPLPDGTLLGIAIKVADKSELQQSDYITINAWIQRKLINDAAVAARTNGQAEAAKDNDFAQQQPMGGLLRTEAFPLTLRCRPPKPPLAEEPDDNSLGQRAKRFANAQLDVERVTTAARWTREEKAALAWVQLYIIVNLLPAEEAFVVTIPNKPHVRDLVQTLLDSHLAILHPEPVETIDEPLRLICLRSTFWQNAYPFSHPPWLYTFDGARLPIDVRNAVPSLPTMSSTYYAYHPLRPRKPSSADGPIYSRYIVELGQTLTFEPVSSQDDDFVRLFTKWQNDDRVAKGWRQRGSEADQRRYLQSIEASPHTLSLVGKWNGEPWGYLEVYWAKESNVSAFYPADDYDRGVHALVGEERFRGPHRVKNWMGSIFHMLFTLDARTQRVILEPRATNEKMIRYTTMFGGHVEKLIDLPHKRAALVICQRERFFQQFPFAAVSATTSAAPSSQASSHTPANGSASD